MYSGCLSLLAYVLVAKRDYQRAALHFSTALAALRGSRYADEYLKATIVAGLGSLASELLDPHITRLMLNAAEEMVWPPSADALRYEATQALGWIAVQDGDHERAWELFERAADVAPTPAYAGAAEVNKVALLRALHEPFAAGRYAAKAAAALRDVRWAEAGTDERMALLDLALEAASVDPGCAIDALARYRTIGRTGDRAFALSDDPRVHAHEAHARGRVAAAGMRPEDAVDDLRTAFDTWTRLGFAWRAALAALDLYALTRTEEYLAHARTIARRAPHSWVSRAVAEAGQAPSSDLPRLGIAERRVVRLICDGKTSKQIAADLGKSEFTIRNQTKRIFKAFGVRTRSALATECARRGIFDTGADQPGRRRT